MICRGIAKLWNMCLLRHSRGSIARLYSGEPLPANAGAFCRASHRISADSPVEEAVNIPC